MSQFDIVLEGIADLRGSIGSLRAENGEGHKSIEGTLSLLRREIDGVIAQQQAHGLAIARAETTCRHRHAKDTDEARTVRGIDQRLGAIEQVSVHRAVSRRDLWTAIGGFTAIVGIAITAAKLLLGGGCSW